MRRIPTSLISAAVGLLTASGCTDRSPSAPVAQASLSASPASVTLAQSASSGTTTISIARSAGFMGAVTLDLSGAPAGITATFEPSTTTGDSSILTLRTGTDVSAGMYTLAVTGSAPGVANQSTILAVTVVPLTVITLQLCSDTAPVSFAYQNTGGAWTSAVPTANHAVTFPASPTLGVATHIAHRFDDIVIGQLKVVYARAVELQWFVRCWSTGSKYLTGTVTGLGPSEVAQITMGQSSAVTYSSPTFTLYSVPDGAIDLVARRSGTSPNAIIIRRGLNLPSGSAIPVLDFASSEAFAPVPATLNVTGGGSDTVDVATWLFTSGGTSAPLTSGNDVGSTSALWVLPALQLAAGDLYQVSGAAYANGTRRTAAFYAHHPDGTTVPFLPPLNVPTVSMPTAAPYLPRVQLVSQADYPSMVVASFSYGPSLGADVWATAGYLGGTPGTWDVRLPDLSGIGGLNVWVPPKNTTMVWAVSAFGGAWPEFFLPKPTDGLAYFSASRSGPVSWP